MTVQAIPTPSLLRERLDEIARAAGADAVAVCSADDDATTRERFGAALERGDLATWPYDDGYAARSAAPRSILPDARSVVCIAVDYGAAQAPRQTPLRGRVSRYAWGEDYHRRVRAVLARIAAGLDALAGQTVTRIVCDTAPLAERALAARAGLGWIGKHTNAIVPRVGSFVFLGEIVTTLAIAPDGPSKKSCGSCTRCVSACPTGALRGDYTMDATRCIADLTQRTDAIPRDLRALMGNWVWGCDLCQEVCPPTRRVPTRAAAQAVPPDGYSTTPDLVALLRLRSGAFRRDVRPTAIGWRGAAVLRRNAAVALGNSLDRAAAGALEAALTNDPHPMVRAHAAWALGRIGSPRAYAALERAARSQRDPSVLEEISLALKRPAPER